MDGAERVKNISKTMRWLYNDKRNIDNYVWVYSNLQKFNFIVPIKDLMKYHIKLWWIIFLCFLTRPPSMKNLFRTAKHEKPFSDRQAWKTILEHQGMKNHFRTAKHEKPFSDNNPFWIAIFSTNCYQKYMYCFYFICIFSIFFLLFKKFSCYSNHMF